MESSHVASSLNPRQFSLKFLLFAFPLLGLALAYPEWGYLALLVLPTSMFIGTFYAVVAFVYWLLASDRRHVASFVIRNIARLLLLNLLLVAYAVYATWFHGALSLD